MTHEEAVKAWEKAKTEADEADRVAAEKNRARFEAERDVLRIEDRLHTPRGQWLEAWLAEDWTACDHALDLQYPRQAVVKRPATADEVAALQAEAEAAEATR